LIIRKVEGLPRYVSSCVAMYSRYWIYTSIQKNKGMKHISSIQWCEYPKISDEQEI